jgi:hypothetical protein
MLVDWNALDRAKSLIIPEPLGGEGIVFKDRLGNLHVWGTFLDPEAAPPHLLRALGNLSPLWDDFSTLLSLLARMERDLEHRDSGQLDEFLWLQFSRMDVEMFFVLFRSLFDHLGGVLQCLTRAPDSTPSNFHDLRAFVNSPKSEKFASAELRDLVNGCDWFDDLRGWRDGLVHHGTLPLTFMAPGQLAFQLFGSGWKNLVDMPRLMVNENVVDFRLFAAAYLSRLLVLLDDLALLALKTYSLEESGADPRTSNAGIPILREWFDRLSKLRGVAKPLPPRQP